MKYLELCIVLTVFVFMLPCVVRSDVPVCNNNLMDMENRSIENVSDFCYHKRCIVKCCGLDKVLNHYGNFCQSATRFKKLYSKITNFTTAHVYSWDGYSPKITNMNLGKDFVFVQNTKLSTSYCSFEDYFHKHYYILEDATLKLRTRDGSFITLNSLDYCVDYRVNLTRPISYSLVIRRPLQPDTQVQTAFVAYSMLVSCFFIFLTLFVYCALPQLQNLVGMILMGYLTSLFFTYMLRSTSAISDPMTIEQCRIFTPFLYFFTLSSFCWLNIMSFDIWWTFRGNRKCREIHRRGELSKFKRYCLCAFGVPLLMVIAAVVVNKYVQSEQYKPPFDNCFSDNDQVFNYLHIPIIIIIGLNIILFFMTGYNIWIIKKGISTNSEYRSTKKDEHRLNIYIKIAVLMGVNWVFELCPDTIPWWIYIIMNIFVALLGVAIFFLFVFKKTMLFMLCTRFHIKNQFTENLQASIRSGGGTIFRTRTSTFKSSEKESTQETML